VLRIQCAKCGRAGKYRLAVLIAKYGRDEKLFTWADELTGARASWPGMQMIRVTPGVRTCRKCSEFYSWVIQNAMRPA
jgi:hypothetical protein